MKFEVRSTICCGHSSSLGTLNLLPTCLAFMCSECVEGAISRQDNYHGTSLSHRREKLETCTGGADKRGSRDSPGGLSHLQPQLSNLSPPQKF